MLRRHVRHMMENERKSTKNLHVDDRISLPFTKKACDPASETESPPKCRREECRLRLPDRRAGGRLSGSARALWRRSHLLHHVLQIAGGLGVELAMGTHHARIHGGVDGCGEPRPPARGSLRISRRPEHCWKAPEGPPRTLRHEYQPNLTRNPGEYLTSDGTKEVSMRSSISGASDSDERVEEFD